MHKGETLVGPGPIVVPPVVVPPYLCQEPISETQRVNDFRMATLNRTQITTGILYDRVAGLACLEMFGLRYSGFSSSIGIANNRIAAASVSSFGHFLQAYYEMHAANYAPPAAEPCRGLLRDNALLSNGRGQVLMGALRYRFNYIDSNAVRNNQLFWRGGPVYDVPGRTGSPYLEREVLVAAALVDTLRNGGATFTLAPGYIFSNVNSPLVSATVDFGDGAAAQVLTPGQSVPVNYPSVGGKTVTFTFVYADGWQQTTRSSLFVKRIGCTNCRNHTTETRECFNAPLLAGRPFRAVFGRADISYFYSTAFGTTPAKPCANTKVNVTKPVILIDGFDHNNERLAEELYEKGLAYTEANGQPKNFGTELRAAGYDVVVMDMPNVEGTPIRLGPFTYTPILRRSGSDYIERNGLTLVSLIEELNDQLQAAGSTEEIVVVGPSMGGQIARYALAYMEANSISHRTRLFVALDSPHNGANIPIGLQRFIRHYADDTQDSKLVDILQSLDSPASREMTAQYYDFDGTNASTTPFAPHPERPAFLGNLNALRPGGFPANVRRVAVTNGALNGAAQKDKQGRVIADGDQAFLLQQEGVPTGSLAGVLVRVVWQIGLLARPITTASARVNFSTGWGNTGRTMRTFKLFQGERLYDATGPAGSCGLDAGPGGYRKFFGEVSESGWSSGMFQARYFWSVRDRASFIPMLSALGCTYPGYNNCQGVDARYLTCNNGTPFDTYYGPARVNEEHTQLTAGNVAFLKDEILKKTPKPVLAGAAPASICFSPNARKFTIAVLPECVLPGRGQYATTYTWTANPGILITAGTLTAVGGYIKNDTFVEIAGNTAVDSYVTVRVQATRNGFAPSAVTSFTVRVVSAANLTVGYTAPNSYPQNDVVPANENVSFGLGASDGCDLTTLTWKVNGVSYPQSVSSGPTAGRTSIGVNVGSGAICTVEATATNLCDGLPISASKTVSIGTGPNFPNNRLAPLGPTLETYPNPVQGTVSILVGAATGSASAATGTAEVRLYDPYGHLVRHTQGSGSHYSLDTHGLPVGMYNLEVVRGGQVLRKHIEVSH